MKPELILVHHPEIHARWRGICCGRSEAQLSDAGHAMAARLVDELTAFAPAIVFSSPATRAYNVANALASRSGLPTRLDPRLNERKYGEWEGLSWQKIQSMDRFAMANLMDDPENFAPPGGETAIAVQERIMAWYRSLDQDANIVAVSHAGPIGALLGTLNGNPPSDWQSLVPAMGDRVRVALGQSSEAA